jgi:hypothetical protein
MCRMYHGIIGSQLMSEDKIEFVNKWVTWLDSEIRQKVMSDWEKQNKRELKEFLESLLETQ